jgi:hypothetical protein
MNVDELINQLARSSDAADETAGNVGTTGGGTPAATNTAEKRARLETLVAGGLAERFLGRAMSLEQVAKLSDSEVVSLHTRYEVVLGSSATKILGRSVLSMYSDIAAYLKPGINTDSLTNDLETSLLIEHDLNLYAGGLYRGFGRLLAPLSALFITVKHWRAVDEVPVSDRIHVTDGVRADGDCPAATITKEP